MALLRRFLKSLAGRKAGATRGGTPGSHVNKARNKRAANKAIRRFNVEGSTTGRVSRRASCVKEIDRIKEIE